MRDAFDLNAKLDGVSPGRLKFKAGNSACKRAMR